MATDVLYLKMDFDISPSFHKLQMVSVGGSPLNKTTSSLLVYIFLIKY